MATADQIKALLKSHVEEDDLRFYSIALQVAAKEARNGHIKLAEEIKTLVEKAQNQTAKKDSAKTTLFGKAKGNLEGLLAVSYPSTTLSSLVLNDEIRSHLDRVLLEQKQKGRLGEFGLHPRRKLLLVGPPGTGKTLTASMLAHELRLPLYTVVLDSLITRYMGETASKLRLIFDHIQQTRAVYLFDEFDAIGAQRGVNNDVGEIRRVLNSFLQFVEQDDSESILIAATNHPELLDRALYRRFDDILTFKKPEADLIKLLIENTLTLFKCKKLGWKEITKEAEGLSCGEIVRACDDAAKSSILNDEDEISQQLLVRSIKYRKAHQQ